MFAHLAAHVVRLHSRHASGAAALPACIIARASARPPVTPSAARTVASLLATSYERIMDGAKADLVITDPPYNVVIDGHATGLGKIHHRGQQREEHRDKRVHREPLHCARNAIALLI
jgi:hypothetical protein